MHFTELRLQALQGNSSTTMLCNMLGGLDYEIGEFGCACPGPDPTAAAGCSYCAPVNFMADADVPYEARNRYLECGPSTQWPGSTWEVSASHCCKTISALPSGYGDNVPGGYMRDRR